MRDRHDFTNAERPEVLAQARLLVGRTLRQLYGEDVEVPKGKGAFGQLVEWLHFGYPPNSLKEADFPVANLELKATGAVVTSNGWRAKERLVLGNINYGELAEEEQFEASTFYVKNGQLLLVVYFWVAEKSPLEYRILGVGVIGMADMDPADRQIIKDDWKKIRQAILDGRAHELSEGDTVYLKAARKGAGTGQDDRRQPFSSVPAPNRAFSFRQSFLSRLIEPLIDGAKILREDEQALVQDEVELETKTFDDLVLERFEPFLGRTVEDLASDLDPSLNRRAKGFYADLARRMLGVSTRRIEEFEKADISMKTVRIQGRRKRPRESMAFPAFRYRDLAHQTWLDSDLHDALSKRFLFVFFVHDGESYRLSHVAFWAMPETTLEDEVRPVWEETVRRIESGRAHDLPSSGDSRVAHVRPHARNAADTDITPYGSNVVKKSFWLNASFIGEIFEETARTHEL